MLGDGCMEKFPRTDKITISFNRKGQEHLQHVSNMIYLLFSKKPSIRIRKVGKCDDLYLYQKNISQRFGFPYGSKIRNYLSIPQWIKDDKLYLQRCLKGLFETDGDWFVDKKYKMLSSSTTTLRVYCKMFTNHF